LFDVATGAAVAVREAGTFAQVYGVCIRLPVCQWQLVAVMLSFGWCCAANMHSMHSQGLGKALGVRLLFWCTSQQQLVTVWCMVIVLCIHVTCGSRSGG
jgi:hypothetical protein